jgi:hypothetical protein
MGLPPIPLPDTLKGVDDLIRSGFEEFRELWFTRLLVSTALVVAGLLFEAPEIWHESVEAIKVLCQSCKPKRDIPAWMKLVGTLGWVLIVVGVTGEFVADSFVSKADGFVQKFDEILLADAQRKTGLASERAASAFDRAAKTEREASQENERAAKTEQQASEENERAAKALKAAEEARRNAEGLELQIAQADERAARADQNAAEANRQAEQERLARVKIEQQLAPRVLTEEQQRRIKEKVGLFLGTPYELLVDPEPEAISLITTIDTVLRSAAWLDKESEKKEFRFTFTLPSGSKVEQSYFSGIFIQITDALSRKYGKGAEKLVEALRAEGLNAELSRLPANDPSPNTIHIAIGSK